MNKTVRNVCIISVIAAFITIAFSQIDPIISGLFFSRTHGFYMREEPINVFIKENMYLIDLGALALMVGFWIGGKINKESFFAVKRESLIFLFSSFAAVMLIGAMMKDLWHRPRPTSVDIFGGTEEFESPLVIVSDSIEKSYSFPSGHTLCAMWLLSIALLLPKALRTAGVIFVSAFTLLVMFARVTGGYHFLSDTIFSCLIAVPIIVFMKNKICGED